MPPTLPQPEQFDAALDFLLRTYARAEGAIIETLRDAVVGGWDYQQAQERLQQVERELDTLLAQANVQDAAHVRDAYGAGQRYADSYLREVEGSPFDAPAVQSAIPTEALQKLAAEVAGQRDLFVRAILRQTDDFLRGVAAGEVGAGLITGSDSYRIGRNIREQLIAGVRQGNLLDEVASGILSASGVKYTDGSTHSLQSYGQMSGRTGLAHALRVGQEDRLLAMDCHLVKIPENGTLCFRCFPFEGKVFALDAVGQAMGYPHISEWRKFGEHPHCRHIGYIPVMTPGKGDTAPDPELLDSSLPELYQRMRDEHPRFMAATRQGFGNRSELTLWQQANPDVSFEQLRGPRFRYADIERRRAAAVTEMLKRPGLSYADAMDEQTAIFMQSEEYARQRPGVTPAAQADAVKAMVGG